MSRLTLWETVLAGQSNKESKEPNIEAVVLKWRWILSPWHFYLIMVLYISDILDIGILMNQSCAYPRMLVWLVQHQDACIYKVDAL